MIIVRISIVLSYIFWIAIAIGFFVFEVMVLRFLNLPPASLFELGSSTLFISLLKLFSIMMLVSVLAVIPAMFGQFCVGIVDDMYKDITRSSNKRVK